MKCNSYKESLRKIVKAKDYHIDAMNTTISATQKFLSSHETFQINNVKLLNEALSKATQIDGIAPTLAADLSYFLTKDANDPVGYEEICCFLRNSFLPILNEIQKTYQMCFNNEYEKLQIFIEKLQKYEDLMQTAEDNFKKDCEEIESANKNKGSKKAEEKFNEKAFEFKNIRQQTIDAIAEYSAVEREYMAKCDAFFSEYEQIDHDRYLQMQNLFSTVQTLIERLCDPNNEHRNDIMKKTKSIKEEENIMNYEIKPVETKIPSVTPNIDLDFPYAKFLDINSIFATHLSQKFAHAKQEIMKGGSILAEAGDRVIVRSVNEGVALISNHDDSLRTAVSLDVLEMRPEFDRYLATIKNGPNEGHVVCVTDSGDLCEVITEWGTCELIKSVDLI